MRRNRRELSYGTTSMLTISQNPDLRHRILGASTGILQVPEVDQSVASLTSSDERQLYTFIGGRAFTSQSEIYTLPADDEEHTRLDMQHFAICLVMDSLFPFNDLIKSALARPTKSRHAILDIGTGSGRWAVDMATSFPDVEVVGIDLVPPALIPKEKVPENCRFEIDDANLRMDHFADTFSLVHARMADGGLNSTESFMYEMARVTKPGGVFLLATGDMQLYDKDFLPLPWVEHGEPSFSWVQYVVGHAYRASWNRGCVSVNERLWWKEWLNENPNYCEVREHNVFVPLGPWKEGMDDRQTFSANLMRENIARVLVAFRRLLFADGHREEDIDCWIAEAIQELKQTTVHSYIRFPYLAAIRADEPWQERPLRETLIDLTSRSLIKNADVTKPWSRRTSVPSARS